MSIEKLNQLKFLELSRFKLPIGQYAITGSGPMGVRNLRKINDIDIIVSQELWETLAHEYGIIEEVKGIQKIALSPEIEAFSDRSFTNSEKSGIPTVLERIRQAEIINGLPFESLENNIIFKKKLGREKDLIDIKLIQDWQNAHSERHEK